MFSGCLGTGSALIIAAVVPLPWHYLACPVVGATMFVLAWKFLAHLYRALDAAKPGKR
jgi:TRAP-type C4-dicarboxylate transport system permease small subunit